MQPPLREQYSKMRLVHGLSVWKQHASGFLQPELATRYRHRCLAVQQTKCLAARQLLRSILLSPAYAAQQVPSLQQYVLALQVCALALACLALCLHSTSARQVCERPDTRQSKRQRCLPEDPAGSADLRVCARVAGAPVGACARHTHFCERAGRQPGCRQLPRELCSSGGARTYRVPGTA